MDKEIIFNRIKYVNLLLKKLKKSIEKYDYYIKENNSSDLEIVEGAIERFSEIIIESCIKINMELLKSINEIPETYYDSFIKLKKLNLFEDDFLKKISSTASFRNRLAHDYMNLNEKVMIITSKKILELFPKYLDEIINFINN